jgi:phage/conjugal plasmid C-4 type zinc finger TraR family protein
MASGWAPDGAVQEQIDASVEDAVKLAREQLVGGESLGHCEECEGVIPEARRRAIPGVRYCVLCQSLLEKEQAVQGSINRRASKDSQLR